MPTETRETNCSLDEKINFFLCLIVNIIRTETNGLMAHVEQAAPNPRKLHKVRPATTGLTQTPDLLQVGSLLLFVELCASAFIVLVPAIDSLAVGLPALCVCLAPALWLACKACILTAADPTDSIVKESYKLRTEGV